MSALVKTTVQNYSNRLRFDVLPSLLQVVHESDDEKAHLIVSQSTRQDSGLYETRVQNELGHEMSTFSVNVLGNDKKRFRLFIVLVWPI